MFAGPLSDFIIVELLANSAMNWRRLIHRVNRVLPGIARATPLSGWPVTRLPAVRADYRSGLRVMATC